MAEVFLDGVGLTFHTRTDRRPALKLSREIRSALVAGFRLGLTCGRLPGAENTATRVAQVHLTPRCGDEESPARRAN